MQLCDLSVYVLWQGSEAVALSRQSSPDKLPSAAALAFSADGSRLLMATPEARLVVIDLDKNEVRDACDWPQIPYGLVACSAGNFNNVRASWTMWEVCR